MQKKRLKLDCSAYPETLPAGPEDVMRSTLTYVSLLKPTSFQHSVLWGAGKKRFGDLSSDMSVPMKALPMY